MSSKFDLGRKAATIKPHMQLHELRLWGEYLRLESAVQINRERSTQAISSRDLAWIFLSSRFQSPVGSEGVRTPEGSRPGPIDSRDLNVASC